MECKDCLYYRICSSLSEEYNLNFMFKTSAETCQDFKDKSKIIELPCKIGDTVYIITNTYYDVVQATVIGVWACEGSNAIITEYGSIYPDSWSKTVFLTREEAEQALREREQQ